MGKMKGKKWSTLWSRKKQDICWKNENIQNRIKIEEKAKKIINGVYTEMCGNEDNHFCAYLKL